MDARDRREWRRAWRMVLWPAFLLGMAWLVAMPIRFEVEPLPKITTTCVQEPARYELLDVYPRPVAGGRYFLASVDDKFSLERPIPSYEVSYARGARCLLNLEERQIVRRYHSDSYGEDSFVANSAEYDHELAGRLFLTRDHLPSTLLHLDGNTGSDMLFFHQTLFEPSVELTEIDPLTGSFTPMGRIPFHGWPESVSMDGRFAICGRWSENTPRFEWDGAFPTRVLVSLPEGKAIGEIPTPGMTYFLSNDAAICFSPYGPLRVDLASGAYSRIPPIPGSPAVLIPHETTFYRHDDKNYMGFLYYENWTEPPLVYRIELSDPPHVERLNLSIAGLKMDFPGTKRSSGWEYIRGINYGRKLLIAFYASLAGRRWYLIDGETGQVLVRQESPLPMDFIGTDYLKASRAIVFPELLGPIRPESLAATNPWEPNAADYYTTQTLHVPDYIRLDDILPAAFGR